MSRRRQAAPWLLNISEYLIDQAGMGSSPGSAFGAAGEGHIRFAFSCSTDRVHEVAERSSRSCRPSVAESALGAWGAVEHAVDVVGFVDTADVVARLGGAHHF